MYCLRGRTKIGVQLCFVHAKVTKLSHSDNDMAEKLGQLLIDRPTKNVLYEAKACKCRTPYGHCDNMTDAVPMILSEVNKITRRLVRYKIIQLYIVCVPALRWQTARHMSFRQCCPSAKTQRKRRIRMAFDFMKNERLDLKT